MKPLQDPRSQPWQGGRDGLWPIVHTHGELERAEREWLHTNGAGAYAMSTLCVMHTRRHHGIFVASLDPPIKRHVILSHFETNVEVNGRTYRLSTHQFPNVAPTPGYRLLQTFAQDPLPRWIYQLGKGAFERSLCLVRGTNVLILGYTWRGRGAARLWLRPLMPLRPAESLTREHGAMMQRVTLRSGAVEVQPILDLPAITFGHQGVFMGSPDWWRRFEYVEDREAGLEFQEDMWTPGVFEFQLEPSVTTYVLVSVGALPVEPAPELFEKAAGFLRSVDPGPSRPPPERLLSFAAEQFCVAECKRPAILAGYPALEARTRDILLSLPGLFITRGRATDAKRILDTVLGLQRGGLLCDGLQQTSDGRRSAMPDATLWLFEAARSLMKVVPADDEYLKGRLYPALLRAFVRIRSKARRYVWLSADGLLANYDEHRPLTWMDAHVGSRLVTPRRGLAVEFQALWSKGCETLATLAQSYGHRSVALAAERASDAARVAFRERFWCNETDYPFDCMSEARDSADAWADHSIRPNALIALAVDPDLFETWQASAIIDRVRRELLTPRGIRSLSSADRNYVGQFGASLEEYEAAYHQGSGWPHLLGFFARAALRLTDQDEEIAKNLYKTVSGLVDGGLLLGNVAQMSTGDSPFRSRGSPAYAAAVAELLRILREELAANCSQ